MDVFDSDKHAAIAINCYVGGLGIIRSLGRRGIPVLGLDRKSKTIGLYSKYCQYIQCPDPGENEREFAEFLLQIGPKFRRKAVLLPSDDTWLVAISKYRNELEEYYIFPMSDWSIIEKCIDKRHTYEEALKANVPVPKSIFVDDPADIDNGLLKEMQYPVCVKGTTPAAKIFFITHFGGKGFVFADEKDLRRETESLLRERIPFAIQEFVVGSQNNIVTVKTVFDRDSKPVLIFLDRKIRQEPPDMGTIRLGKSDWDEQMARYAIRLLQSLRFYGPATVEFKTDERSGIPKLMEINARISLNNSHASACGLDIPWTTYRVALGHVLPEASCDEPNYPLGVRWWFSDLANIRTYKLYKHEDFFYELLYCFAPGKITPAIFSITDPGPFIYVVQSRWRSILNRILPRRQQ